MKRINKITSMKIGWIFIVAIWGLVIPEFCFTEDSINVYEEGIKLEEYDSSDIFFDMQQSGSNIQIKSKLLEMWKDR